MKASFYHAFEERHRGPRDLIKTRLEVYLPFLEPLKTVFEQPEALDLGCGRGEWLELLQEQGFKAQGVDQDEGMLSECKTLHLDVLHTDLLDYLSRMEANSLSVISAFHVIEHIPFESLRQLIDEAHRILKPAGLLILETPNTENLVMGTSSFYLDPTHQRPIPALLLSFLLEYAGFDRLKTLYLNESAELATEKRVNLAHVIGGASPDYAVVAQKKHHMNEVNALFNLAFNGFYGVSLSSLADRYDRQVAEQIQQLEYLQTVVDRIKLKLAWLRLPLRMAQYLRRALPQKCRNTVALFRKTMGSLRSFRWKSFMGRIFLKPIKKSVARLNIRSAAAIKPPTLEESIENLSPRAASIYAKLKKAKSIRKS